MSPELERALSEQGVRWTELHGCRVPGVFSTAAAERRALREGGAVALAAHRAAIRACGRDHVSFLQGMLSNDVAGLRPGEGTYAALLTQQGKVVTDLRIHRAADAVLLDLCRWRTEAFLSWIGRFVVADDVTFERPDDARPLLFLLGPQAGRLLARLAEPGAAPEPGPAFGPVRVAGERLWVARVRECGADGYLLFGAEALAAALLEAARRAGAAPVGMDALVLLRLEAQVPWPGLDMDEAILVWEAGLGAAVSATKGCYLGQEVVERIAARGHVNRHLRGLWIEGGWVPPPGAPLTAGAHRVGWVTSAAADPEVPGVWALGYVHRDWAAEGTRLEVEAEGMRVPARVRPPAAEAARLADAAKRATRRR